jgi:hypothetical protein
MAARAWRAVLRGRGWVVEVGRGEGRGEGGTREVELRIALTAGSSRPERSSR